MDFCGRGATLVAARETQRLPALRGSIQRAAAPATLFRPPGHPCRKESQTFWFYPLSDSVDRDGSGVVNPRTRVSGTRAIEGNRPPCLQKFLDLDPSRATGPRAWNKSFCPRPQRATGPRVYKSSSKTGPPGDNRSHRNPDLPRKNWTILQGMHCVT